MKRHGARARLRAAACRILVESTIVEAMWSLRVKRGMAPIIVTPVHGGIMIERGVPVRS